MKTNQTKPIGTSTFNVRGSMFNVLLTLLPLLLLLALPAAVQAQDYTYTTNAGTITITGYTGPGGAVTIPSTINGLPVTRIWNNAFYRSTSLTSVTIPNSVISIGQHAFDSCTSLSSVAIPNSVTYIGYEAFIYCTSLTSATIPSSVTSIGIFTFLGCTSLSAITVDTNNPAYSSMAGVLFNKSQTVLIQCPAGKAGTYYTIPNSVTSIGEEAFYGCANLTNVTIGTSVTDVPVGGGAVFFYCTSLTGITVDTNNPVYSSVSGVLFNKSQTTLIQYPFGRVGSYTIPNGVTKIGEAAFYLCNSLNGLYFQGNAPSIAGPLYGGGPVYYLPGTTGWGATFGGCPTAFWDPPTQFGYTTNGNTITIKGYAGVGAGLTIPDSFNGLPVTSIGDWAFSRCTSLTSITISNSVTSIGNGAFSSCASLTNVTIGNGVTSIGGWAFSSCTSLSSVMIPNSVTNIGDNAFSDCTSLTAITVDAGSSFYSSVDGVLFNKSQTVLIAYPGGKAGSYTVPNSVTSIATEAFFGCCELTNVTIANSVTSIESFTFFGCTSLTSVTIGNGVSNIGGNNMIPGAFSGCTSLTSVYFKGNAPSVGWGAFDGDTNAAVYYLPGTTGWSTNFAGLPTALWFLPNPLILNNSRSFSVQSNGFSFIISWATNIPVVVEACTNLANPTWSPVGTNALTSGSAYFSDPQWTNYPARFYRLRSP